MAVASPSSRRSTLVRTWPAGARPAPLVTPWSAWSSPKPTPVRLFSSRSPEKCHFQLHTYPVVGSERIFPETSCSPLPSALASNLKLTSERNTAPFVYAAPSLLHSLINGLPDMILRATQPLVTRIHQLETQVEGVLVAPNQTCQRASAQVSHKMSSAGGAPEVSLPIFPQPFAHHPVCELCGGPVLDLTTKWCILCESDSLVEAACFYQEARTRACDMSTNDVLEPVPEPSWPDVWAPHAAAQLANDCLVTQPRIAAFGVACATDDIFCTDFPETQSQDAATVPSPNAASSPLNPLASPFLSLMDSCSVGCFCTPA